MKSYKYLIAILLCLIFMAGCGSTEPEEVQENIPTADWKLNGFAVSGEVIDEQGLWVETNIPWSHDGVSWNEGTEESYPQVDAVYQDGKIYQLYPIMVPPEVTTIRGVLEIFDTASMESTVKELAPEQMGFQDFDGWVLGMDVIGDQEYIFQIISFDREESEKSVYTYKGLAYLNQEGDIQWTNLLSFYLEKGLIEADRIVLGGKSCFHDALGNSYVMSDNFDELFILDRNGELLMSWEGADKEQLYFPVKTEDGELIFPFRNHAEGFTRTSLIWFDVENGRTQTLADLGREWVKQLYGMQGNYLYYEGQYGIVKWDVVSGTRQLVFRFTENGVSSSYQTMLLLREGEVPILRAYGTISGEEYDWLVILSEEPVERPDAIRVVSLTESSNRVKNCAAVASRKNPNYVFSYAESGKKDPEDFRTEILAEMVAGGGPDILYVSREDMELLQRRGLLADLRTLLSEETLSQVMPGVIELGTVDGTLVGMTPGVFARTLMVGENVWSGDSWTIDDVLGLMESGQLEKRILINTRTMYYYPLAVTRIIVDYNLEDSFLIDWENRESHFEDERFIRLLKCIGKDVPPPVENTQDDRLQGGGSLMVEVILGSTGSVSTFQGSREAEGSHYVGFPTEGGNGNYLVSNGVLVVNKNLSDLEAVSAYLECLWGNEIQELEDKGYELPVTLPSTDDISYNAETGMARWHGHSLTVFEDGTTSIHEASAFLAQCVPEPRTYADLERIIYEELSAYFEEAGRTAEDTARIIDNRIQVYLDEGN